MSGLLRKTQQLFGGALTAAGNIARWGSLAAGTPAFSNDPAQIQTTAFLNGLQAALIGNRSPALEDLNGLFYLITYQLQYLLARGMPDYDPDTQYNLNDLCKVNSVLYISQSNNNTGNNPVTDGGTNWKPYLSTIRSPNMALAWVCFDGINSTGGNANLINAFNVSTVGRNALGSYTINFTSPLPSANYTLGGSCGSQDGNAYGAGDTGVVVGNFPGQGNAIRNINACRLFTMDPSSKALVQSGVVSAVFFGS